MTTTATLVLPATVTGDDTENGGTLTVKLPAGRRVFADRMIACPTIHGGGFEATITDPDTGFTGHGRVTL